MTSIGAYALAGVGRRVGDPHSLTIPNSVTSIGEEAFQYCGLTSVSIPNSVTSIGHDAFAGCSKLAYVTSLNPSPPHVEYHAFSDLPYGYLYVPNKAYGRYAQTDPWKDMGRIIGINPETDTGIDTKLISEDHYLQNIKTGQFLTAANDWGTQASIDDTGIILHIADINSDKPVSYSIDTKIFNNATDHFLNITPEGTVFCDQPIGQWYFIKVGDGVYALTMDYEFYLG